MAEKMEATRTAASLETVADISDLDTVRTPLSCRHSARVCKALSFLSSGGRRGAEAHVERVHAPQLATQGQLPLGARPPPR